MHSPNCNCFDCTSRDPYITKLRNNFGKNAARNGGSQYTGQDFNAYDMAPDHADPLAAGVYKPLPTGPTNTGVAPPKLDLKQVLGNALGTAVGQIIQAKKEGQQLPKGLDVVAELGIKTEQAAYNAAHGKAANTIGENVIKFSPYIIGGIVALILLLVFFVGKKH